MEETVLHIQKSFLGVNYSEKELRSREFIKCECISCD